MAANQKPKIVLEHIATTEPNPVPPRMSLIRGGPHTTSHARSHRRRPAARLGPPYRRFQQRRRDCHSAHVGSERTPFVSDRIPGKTRLVKEAAKETSRSSTVVAGIGIGRFRRMIRAGGRMTVGVMVMNPLVPVRMNCQKARDAEPRRTQPRTPPGTHREARQAVDTELQSDCNFRVSL
jgi:hypothetical protein